MKLVIAHFSCSCILGQGIVKLTDCTLLWVFLHEAKPVKLLGPAFDCAFRRKAASDSDPKRPVIPI